jgi:hypothetical protein
MSTWTFYPFDPRKEAFDNRPFKHAKTLQTILQLFSEASIRPRGQLLLKGGKADHPIDFGKNTFESETMDFKKCLTIEYNSVHELKELLGKVKEQSVSRVIIYQHGYFIQ